MVAEETWTHPRRVRMCAGRPEMGLMAPQEDVVSWSLDEATSARVDLSERVGATEKAKIVQLRKVQLLRP